MKVATWGEHCAIRGRNDRRLGRVCGDHRPESRVTDALGRENVGRQLWRARERCNMCTGTGGAWRQQRGRGGVSMGDMVPV